jgi:microcystin degradation protein MlrC
MGDAHGAKMQAEESSATLMGAEPEATAVVVDSSFHLSANLEQIQSTL